MLFSMMLMFASCAKADMEIDAPGYATEDSMDMVVNSSTGKGQSIGNGMYVDSSSTSTEQGASENTASIDQKIIKNMKIDAETKDFGKTLEEISNIISKYGAYVESSNTTGKRYEYDYQRRSAKLVIRIPADELDAFVEDSESIFNIINTTSTVQNITVEYYDLQSRLDVLKAEKDALNKILEKADNIYNILKIRNQLTDVISDIESIETQLRVYDSLVSYSTLTLTIEEVIEYTEIKREEATWGSRIKDAFIESWQDFADGFKNLSVWLVYAIPTIIVIAIIVSVVIFVVVPLIKKKVQKRNMN